mgnify:CR=1 FL=1
MTEKMSEQPKQIFVHPYSFYLVSRLTEIYMAMQESNLDAIERLYLFCISLDPIVVEKLKDEIEKLKQQVYGGNPNLPLKEQDIDRIYARLWEELHHAGYFLAAKYSPITAKNFKELENEK